MIMIMRILPSLLLLRSLHSLSLSMSSISSSSISTKCGVIVESEKLVQDLGLYQYQYMMEGSVEKLERNSLILYRNSDDNALELKWLDSEIREKPFRIDFISYLFKRQDTAKSELVSKAVGKIETNSFVVDLTSGLGRDSLTLAAAGHHVVMIERNPILFALLEDALSRLKKENSIICNRINLIKYESTTLNTNEESLLKLIDFQNDKVTCYLDPMYAEDSVGKKALVKKETQMLHRILGTEEGNDEINNSNLMNSAIALANNRIVVKRALNAKSLSNWKPHHQIIGKTQRFDVYQKQFIKK